MPARAATPIFTFVIKHANQDGFLSKPIVPKLHLRFKVLTPEGRSNPQCGYWTFNTGSANNKAGSKPRGRWSTKGCEVKGYQHISKYRQSFEYVNCSCDTVSALGVLMDLSAEQVRH